MEGFLFKELGGRFRPPVSCQAAFLGFLALAGFGAEVMSNGMPCGSQLFSLPIWSGVRPDFSGLEKARSS
jgi:hypothetical protein